MNPAYRHVPVAELRPGMVLSDEILDDLGQVLLARHAVLSARTISQLQARDIALVAVLGPAQTPEVDTARTLARINHLFRKNDPDDADDWATGILRRYVTDYRLNREIEE
jgi:hypothetical protein